MRAKPAHGDPQIQCQPSSPGLAKKTFADQSSTSAITAGLKFVGFDGVTAEPSSCAVVRATAAGEHRRRLDRPIAARKVQVKRTRKRLGNPRALERWNEGSG